MSSRSISAVLTIAGSDSGGGAGIQADLKTFTAQKCYGTSVITALTAQNTIGVQAVHPCPPTFVEKQLSSVLDDISIHAIKTGMLCDAETIRVIANKLRTHFASSDRQLPPIVCDPVFVSTSGHALLASDAVKTLVNEIFPLAALITPNKSEAELILSCHQGIPSSITNLEEMLSASSTLLSFGSKAVLLKGGHITTTLAEVEAMSRTNPEISVVTDGLLDENMEILQLDEHDHSPDLVADVLQQGPVAGQSIRTTILFVHPHIDSTSTHGSGCTLSAAITCGLAQALSLPEAVQLGISYTHLGIETALSIGNGNGPLNHIHSTVQRILPRPTKGNPYPLTYMLIKSTSSLWKEYVEHDFVKELGKGVLDKRRFIHFMKQDYHYLKYYARAYALLAAKSQTFAAIELSTRNIQNIIHEVSTTHMVFCRQWGITEDELESTPESSATTAYGAFIMDVGLQGDTSKLTMALAACLLGYGEVGQWLMRESQRQGPWVILDENVNPYVPWIQDYAGERFQEAVNAGLAAMEKIGETDLPTKSKFEEWQAIWKRCVRLEKGFWDMSMNLS